ncbi:MAG: DHH family phosphoesterase, partial [Desulfobacteraceae bacterium]
MKKQWHIHRPNDKKVRALQRHLNCSAIIATILCNRKLESPQLANEFLSPSLYHLKPPFVMQDMEKAVERIEYALQKKQRILILGDYDVDGVTATAALYTFLQRAGAHVFYHIPHRIDEGYGLSSFHIHQFAVPKKIQLIITVDNGSSSYDA